MVKHLSLALVALASLASLGDAGPVTPPFDERDDDLAVTEADDDSPAFNMLGFQFASGELPIGSAHTLALSLGLTIEHPVWPKLRVVGEYDALWLVHRPTRDADATSMVLPPDRHTSGHRAGLAVRRELFGRGNSSARSFLDGELGASLALATDNFAGPQLVPAVFTGLRAGFDFYSPDDDSASRTLEVAMLLRAIAVSSGVGLALGVGLHWGN